MTNKAWRLRAGLLEHCYVELRYRDYFIVFAIFTLKYRYRYRTMILLYIIGLTNSVNYICMQELICIFPPASPPPS